MYSVYIIQSLKSDAYYIGHTKDVEKRLIEHNNPLRNTKYTAKHIPWKLITHFEIFNTRSEAMKAEKFIKNQKSRGFIEKLIQNKNNPAFIDLLIHTT